MFNTIGDDLIEGKRTIIEENSSSKKIGIYYVFKRKYCINCY